MSRNAAAERRAADWAVAEDRGLTSEEQVSLDQWLAADGRHEGALVRARAVWAAAVGAAQPSVRPKAAPQIARRRLILGGGLAASFAAAGLSFLLLGGKSYRTPRGEVRRFAMEDGSQAVMNSGTRMVVRFSEQKREVALKEGEAWFEVAKDRRRPFIVSTASATVTAVGTAFTVREDDEATEIIVSEGTVQVRSGAGTPVALSQGGRLRLERAGSARTSHLEVQQVQRRLAWRDGLIMLDGERLADAAAQFNRYSRRPIRVSPEIADRQVVGVFSLQDAEGFARTSGRLLSVPVKIDADELHIGPPDTFTELSQ